MTGLPFVLVTGSMAVRFLLGIFILVLIGLACYDPSGRDTSGFPFMPSQTLTLKGVASVWSVTTSALLARAPAPFLLPGMARWIPQEHMKEEKFHKKLFGTGRKLPDLHRPYTVRPMTTTSSSSLSRRRILLAGGEVPPRLSLPTPPDDVGPVTSKAGMSSCSRISSGLAAQSGFSCPEGGAPTGLSSTTTAKSVSASSS